MSIVTVAHLVEAAHEMLDNEDLLNEGKSISVSDHVALVPAPGVDPIIVPDSDRSITTMPVEGHSAARRLRQPEVAVCALA